jgi:hypothetical protein
MMCEAPVPAADLAWLHHIPHLQPISQARNIATLSSALDLLVELWPKPGYQTVIIETHQWIKLRRVLLEIPRLVATDE